MSSAPDPVTSPPAPADAAALDRLRPELERLGRDRAAAISRLMAAAAEVGSPGGGWPEYADHIYFAGRFLAGAGVTAVPPAEAMPAAAVPPDPDYPAAERYAGVLLAAALAGDRVAFDAAAVHVALLADVAGHAAALAAGRVAPTRARPALPAFANVVVTAAVRAVTRAGRGRWEGHYAPLFATRFREACTAAGASSDGRSPWGPAWGREALAGLTADARAGLAGFLGGTNGPFHDRPTRPDPDALDAAEAAALWWPGGGRPLHGLIQLVDALAAGWHCYRRSADLLPEPGNGREAAGRAADCGRLYRRYRDLAAAACGPSIPAAAALAASEPAARDLECRGAGEHRPAVERASLLLGVLLTAGAETGPGAGGDVEGGLRAEYREVRGQLLAAAAAAGQAVPPSVGVRWEEATRPDAPWDGSVTHAGLVRRIAEAATAWPALVTEAECGPDPTPATPAPAGDKPGPKVDPALVAEDAALAPDWEAWKDDPANVKAATHEAFAAARQGRYPTVAKFKGNMHKDAGRLTKADVVKSLKRHDVRRRRSTV